MGLEAVTYISDFVITNPVGATDPKSQGDDHIRNLKKGVKQSFPAISGAVTATHGELNELAGAAAGAGMVHDIAVLTDANADRILFWDDSAGNVAQLAADGTNVTISGTTLGLGAALSLTAATFSGTVGANLFSGSGASLTALPAASLTGSIADARLSANIPLLNAANAFSETPQKIQKSGGASLWLTDLGAGSNEKAYGFVSTAGVWALQTITDAGSPTANAISVTRSGTTVGTVTLNGTALTLNAATLTTPNASASEVGYKGLPINAQNAYTLVLSDAGKHISQGSSGITLTIPANGSVAFPVGTTIAVVNGSGGSNTIAITTDTMYLAGTALGSTGSRTLASGGVATLIKISATAWFIMGPGVS